MSGLTQSAVELDDGNIGADKIQQKYQSLIECISAEKANHKVSPDWGEARQLAVSQVQRERDFAVTRFDDFRQMIWVVIQGLREAFRDEQNAEDEAAIHLTRDELRTKTIELSVFSGQSFCLLMVDVDFLKKINDAYGHATGGAAVLHVA